MGEVKLASGNPRWGLIGAIGPLAIMVAWFVSERLHYVADFSEDSFTPYFCFLFGVSWLPPSLSLSSS